MKYRKDKAALYLELANCIRILAADAIEKANSGHPGMPLGMADVMTILAFHYLKFNINDPKWFNRDRLVLSNGHGSMLLYAFYYLTGHKDFTLDDIKNFRQINSKAAGHPEYHSYAAIEATTGPLGQGFGNAVGMAIAQKKYAENLGNNICSYKIYCMVGDGCLMEGISYEAASLAGHLALDNLIVLFDDNKITIDGKTDLTISENQLAKFKSFGWTVYSVDGHDPTAIYNVLKKAQKSIRPVFIDCKTSIGKGTKNKINTELAHGAPLGPEEVKQLKVDLNFKDEEFFIPPSWLKLWRTAGSQYEGIYKKWQKNSILLKINVNKINFQKLIKLINKSEFTSSKEATRVSSGKVIQQLMTGTDKIICGSCDLSLSNNLKNSFSKVISKNHFSGNFIHYGVREHAMSAIMNGLALSGFLPIGGTFLCFSDYMKAGIRLSAMMNQKVLYIMTHDSIGLGEDGPTHQPVEHLAMLRAIPNLKVFRPADFVETVECYEAALQCEGPVVLALTRQNVSQIRKFEPDNLSAKGAYIILNNDNLNLDICIWATGSEVELALEVANILKVEVSVRVISIPSFELFYSQSAEYIKSVKAMPKLHTAIEAASSFGWHKIIGSDGEFFGVEDFGISAPYHEIYNHFGLTPQKIAIRIKQRLAKIHF